MSCEAEFNAWIARMQIPNDVVPDKNTIKLLLSKNLIFNDICTRVRPIKEVALKRNQLKVHHHDQLKKQKGHVPEQFKLYKEITAVTEVYESLKQECYRMEKTFHEKFSKANEGEITVIQTKNKLEHAKVKHSLLELKLQDLQKVLEKEKEKHDDILNAFSPGTNKVKSNNQVVYQHEIDSILSDCQKELTNFYNRPQSETCTEAAQNQIWQSMQKLIDPVPRLVLWRALMSSQERIINKLKSMIDICREGVKPRSKREVIEASLDYAVTFINAKELLSKLNIKTNLKPKVDSLSSVNDEALGSFACVVDDALNTDETYIENRQSLIEQFVFTIAKHLVLDAELKYIDNTMDKLRDQHTRVHQEIDSQGTKVMIETTHRLYGELESVVRDLEGEVAKVYQLKNKLDVEKKFNEDFIRNKFKLNTTMISSNNVTAVTMQYPTQYNTELAIFDQLPINKLKFNGTTYRSCCETYPYILAFDMSPSEMRYLPNCYLTAKELKEYLKREANFKKDVEFLKKPLDVGFKPDTVPEEELNAHMVKNIEDMTEFVDKIAYVHGVTEKNIINCENLLNFLENNPLKKFIPVSHLFNGRPYNDYDNDFSMHYHLHKTGDE